MGWLFYTLLLVCCFCVRADEAQTQEELNELSRKLEKVERIEKYLENKVQRKNVYDEPVNQELKRETASGKDCQEVYNNGGKASGVYTISLSDTDEIEVYCEQELQGGGWTVFQRRTNGNVDFYRGWDDYKNGFGSTTGEHWIGNDRLHQLTANQDTQLLVELKYKGETAYAKYAEFWIQDEQSNYTLHISDYSGSAGDALDYNNGMSFTTKDRDNDIVDVNCAQYSPGGWWYRGCHYANLNGLSNENNFKGIVWYQWKGYDTCLSATRMMVKPR